MRKVIVIAIFAALALAPVSTQVAFAERMAQGQDYGSFSGPVSGAMADTAAKALDLPDDAPVVLTGNIISQVAGSKDRYIFKDATGEVPVKIRGKVFAGQNVTPADTVRISGKVDKDWGKELKIKAKRIEIVR